RGSYRRRHHANVARRELAAQPGVLDVLRARPAPRTARRARFTGAGPAAKPFRAHDFEHMNSASSAPQWPAIPYKGLSFYTPEDATLFAGRHRDVRDCARLLTRDRTKVLLLQGRSGNGKSSFLRAGLIPYLESKVPVFSFLREFDITQ